LLKDKKYIYEVLKNGSEKVNIEASNTISDVRKRMGID